MAARRCLAAMDISANPGAAESQALALVIAEMARSDVDFVALVNAGLGRSEPSSGLDERTHETLARGPLRISRVRH